MLGAPLPALSQPTTSLQWPLAACHARRVLAAEWQGQSNMEFTLNGADNASAEIADSINYPNLRLAPVATQLSPTPMANAPGIANYTEGGKLVAWRRSGPSAFAPADTANQTFSGLFSAVCYLFGRDLYRQLGGSVPIGLVAAAVGGIKIERLMSTEALSDASCGGTAFAASNGSNGSAAIDAGDVWNGMIVPLVCRAAA